MNRGNETFVGMKVAGQYSHNIQAADRRKREIKPRAGGRIAGAAKTPMARRGGAYQALVRESWIKKSATATARSWLPASVAEV